MAHPLTVSVGASGAIFGVIGALLAFLTLHRKAIPMSVVQPMRGGLLSFILYNGLFGAIVPGIDNAAHLGGLVAGFVAGLLVSRPWPVPRPNAGLLRQLGGGVLLAAVLIGLGDGVNALVSRNRDVVALVQEARESKARAARIQQSMAAFNSLMRSLAPAADHYNRINTELATLMERLQQPHDDGADDLRQTVDPLIAEARSSQLFLNGIVVENKNLRRLSNDFAEAQNAQLSALEALARFLENPNDPSPLAGPDGFNAQRRARG